jgi:hypothetical protein
MEVPTIGARKGIFEIFMPGVFLFVNVAANIYLFVKIVSPQRLEKIYDIFRLYFKDGFGPAIIGSTILLVVIIVYAYLCGILLRLFPIRHVDKLSRWWLLLWESNENKWGPIGIFPYKDTLEKVTSEKLITGLFDFFNKSWKYSVNGLEYFNYCKNAVIMNLKNNNETAIEIYALEAMTRYMADMLYALFISMTLMIGNTALIILSLLQEQRPFENTLFWMIIIFPIYLILILSLLYRFRSMRLNEVWAVFEASYFLNKEYLFARKKTKT